MPPKNLKPGQQQPSKVQQNDKTSIAAGNPSTDANESEGEANASGPSNSIILDAIHSLKGELTKQFNSTG